MLKNNSENNIINEIVLLVVLLALAVVILNPFSTFMPGMVVTSLLALFFVIFVVSSIFVWNESVHDEREVLHRSTAGRVGYLAGSAVLVIGIILQEMKGWVDPWLVYTLAAIIVGKMVALIYLRSKN